MFSAPKVIAKYINGDPTKSPMAQTIQSAWSVHRDMNLLSSDPEIVPTSPAITVTIPNPREAWLSLAKKEK